METTTRKGLVLALTCLAQFMVVLDIAIVNVALPTIKLDLGLTESSLQWVVIAAGLLIGARALQGFGAALIAPSALSILAVTFAEGRERNGALGIFGAIGGS